MSNQQPGALQLAARLDPVHSASTTLLDLHREAAAELRRLHSENEVLRHNSDRLARRLIRTSDALMDARAKHAELLDALKAMVALDEEHHQRCQGDEDVCREVRQARAAISNAEGEAA